MKPLDLPPQMLQEDLLKHIPLHAQDAFEEEQQKAGYKTLTDFLAQETFEDYEDLVDALFATIPQELKDKQLAKYQAQQYTLKQATYEALVFLEKRKEGWFYEGNELSKNSLINAIKSINGIQYEIDQFIGKGKAAKVFQIPNDERFCVKFLHTPAQQLNTMEQEFHALTDAYNSSSLFSIIHIPKPEALAKNISGEKSFFTMEQVFGCTLLELIEYPSKKEQILKSLQMTEEELIAFLTDKDKHSKIEKDLEIMHKKGVIHGDIHPRNIMISKNGSLYLIDFGNFVLPTAIHTNTPYEQIENVKDIDISSFKNSLNLTALSLKKGPQAGIDK